MRFLILRARRAARKAVAGCKVRAKFVAKPAVEAVPPLPIWRIEAAAPWSTTRVDAAGPFYVKNVRDAVLLSGNKSR